MSRTREERRIRRYYLRGGLLMIAIIFLAPTVLVGLVEMLVTAICG